MEFLLLQARNQSDRAAAHERLSFAQVIGVALGEIVVWDLLSGAPPASRLASADCVLVGGSGDFRIRDASRHRWLRDFIDTMGRLTLTDTPVFASCFGFQATVAACGGRIGTEKVRAEIGTFDVIVSKDGCDDSLFNTVPRIFAAQFGHVDHAATLPSNLVNLGRTKRNEFQAARVRGKQFYLTQFHPELSMEANRERTIMYAKGYEREGFGDSLDEILANFRPSPAASTLLRRFVTDTVGLRADS